MNLIAVLLISSLLGAASGSFVFFIKEEVDKLATFLAAILRNTTVGLAVAFSIQNNISLWSALFYGFIYGLLTGLTVFLAQGGFRKKEHYPIIIGALISGIITAVLIWKFGFLPAPTP
ncbi:MAG: hypothetical protein U0V74_01515 [Chitinophagales bacterium]